jgi:glyoxylase-like metal-dependent hydrolase (beta-lactamase superfamily II)
MPFGRHHGWREVGPDVFVRRYRSLDLNVGLVLGDGEALLVDTRSTHPEAAELLRDLREVTDLRPSKVVNTHAHFDHSFGNAVFQPCELWAHEGCAAELRLHGEEQRRNAAGWLRGDAARDVETVEIVPPDHLVRDHRALRVGGRLVELRHLGRGHTDHDLVVIVPDARVLFAGDLIEESAPPSFADSYPLDWPEAARRLASFASGTVVPGHGDVVDRAFVERQAADLGAIAASARAAHEQGIPEDAAARLGTLREPFARDAVARAYAQLDGAL